MRRSILLGLTALFSMLFPVAALASFTPDRQTFECINVATEECPGPNFITFNSFTDSPVPDRPNNGDERAFFEAKDATSSTTTQDGFGDNLSVRDGERLLLRVYIHNDANGDVLGDEATMARNVVVKVQLPSSSTNNTSQATATISADNAMPQTVSDTLDFSGNAPFTLGFDQSSPVNMTVRSNNGDGDFVTFPQTGVTFSNNSSMSVTFAGWPGGFKHHGVLTIPAIVHMGSVQPAAFACSSFTSSADTTSTGQATFTAMSNSQAAGANINSFAFTVRDSNGNVVNNSTINTSASSAVYNFNQTTPGTYTVSAVISSDKGSTNSSACSRQITVTQPATLSASTTSPPTANALPNTGAGDVLGVFTGVSVLGAAGHYVFRRLRRL